MGEGAGGGGAEINALLELIPELFHMQTVQAQIRLLLLEQSD